ncbi:MAG: GNAT family N-acetyltransferase [Oscillospiraceae bacterium]|nr:GNAT family N-acetyltransferase [Oscillospiraceae bacterium]
MVIRTATAADLDGVAAVYEAIHDAEEAGQAAIGWVRGVYPTRKTARAALGRGDLFVLEADGEILGTAIINRLQVDVYAGAPWAHAVPDDKVCVLHTLVIHPAASGRGFGGAFVRFYEDYAARSGCTELRMDTNARNLAARAMYRRRGYAEIGVVPTVFNGIPGVDLVLLEKYIGT